MTAILVILVGIFGVVAGWHWKIMHQSWRTTRTAVRRARGRVPALRVARSRDTGKAFWFAVAAVFVIMLIAKVH